MPADVQTRRVVAGLLKYSAFHLIFVIIGIIIGTYLLGPVFLNNVETAWLFIVVYLYAARAVRKAVRSHTRDITWTFAFKPLMEAVAFMAFIACYLASLDGRSAIFGILPEGNHSVIYGGSGLTVILILMGYIVITLITAAIVHHTSVRTIILTKAFVILGVVFFASMIVNINGFIPWIKDLDIYILYLLIMSYFGALFTYNVHSKIAGSVEKNKITKATLRSWMELKIREE